MESAVTAAKSSEDSPQAPINLKLGKDEKVKLLRDMLRIRRFEQESLNQYQKNKMGGFLHLYIGQESVAVGTCSLMGDNDHVITAYRDHGHALAVGMSMNECMAELFGKATGCSKGQGWLDALFRSGQELLGRSRHCRRANTARPWARLRDKIQGTEGRGDVLPRRRRRESGLLLRIAQPRQPL